MSVMQQHNGLNALLQQPDSFGRLANHYFNSTAQRSPGYTTSDSTQSAMQRQDSTGGSVAAGYATAPMCANAPRQDSALTDSSVHYGHFGGLGAVDDYLEDLLNVPGSDLLQPLQATIQRMQYAAAVTAESHSAQEGTPQAVDGGIAALLADSVTPRMSSAVCDDGSCLFEQLQGFLASETADAASYTPTQIMQQQQWQADPNSSAAAAADLCDWQLLERSAAFVQPAVAAAAAAPPGQVSLARLMPGYAGPAGAYYQQQQQQQGMHPAWQPADTVGDNVPTTWRSPAPAAAAGGVRPAGVHAMMPQAAAVLHAGNLVTQVAAAETSGFAPSPAPSATAGADMITSPNSGTAGRSSRRSSTGTPPVVTLPATAAVAARAPSRGSSSSSLKRSRSHLVDTSSDGKPAVAAAAAARLVADAAARGWVGSSGKRPCKGQRISRHRHEQEIGELQQKIDQLAAANAKLQEKTTTLAASEIQLLERVKTLTDNWHKTVTVNAQLEQQNNEAHQQIFALQQQLLQLQLQQGRN